jgi:hypothetical protein
MSKTFTVWVGGIDDITTEDLGKALEVLREWIGEGYGDVCLEVSDE